MKPCTRLFLRLGLALGAAGLVGCGESDEPGAEARSPAIDAGLSEPASSSSDTLRLVFSPMYSAFVEGHPAQLPVRLDRSYGVIARAQYSSADPSIAEIAETAQGAMITVKKEGRVAIKVALDDKTGSALLTINKYSEVQWLLGETRYTRSERAVIPRDGGTLSGLALAIDPAARNPGGACNTCHTQQAQLFQIEDTPMQTAGYTDDELITVFTQGKKPEGADLQTIPTFLWGTAHSWTVSEEEKQGLVAYLRTKVPKPQPLTSSGPRACGDAGPGSLAPLCDVNGNPIRLPTRPVSSDAGLTRTMDGGISDGGV